MVTRAELRSSLRQRLEDTGAGPLWDDTALNDALAGAMRGYGARAPKEATATIVVAAGATRIAVAAPVIDPTRIVRVLDGSGVVVERLADGEGLGEGDLGAAQGWRWWEATLILQRPATAGSWQIEYLAPRIVPTDDGSPVDLLPGDEEIVVALAQATALRRRATEDGKRGSRAGGLAALAETARVEAARLLNARRRRARGGWL